MDCQRRVPHSWTYTLQARQSFRVTARFLRAVNLATFERVRFDVWKIRLCGLFLHVASFPTRHNRAMRRSCCERHLAVLPLIRHHVHLCACSLNLHAPLNLSTM
jgi:hypothetical protein